MNNNYNKEDINNNENNARKKERRERNNEVYLFSCQDLIWCHAKMKNQIDALSSVYEMFWTYFSVNFAKRIDSDNLNNKYYQNGLNYKYKNIIFKQVIFCSILANFINQDKKRIQFHAWLQLHWWFRLENFHSFDYYIIVEMFVLK